MAVCSVIVRPATRTERARSFSRSPWHSGQTTACVKRSTTACLRSDISPSVWM